MFKIFVKCWKDAILKYRATKEEILKKRELLSSHSDWSLIEFYIKKCNDNPYLKVSITLNDNTRIDMRCIAPNETNRSNTGFNASFIEVK